MDILPSLSAPCATPSS